MVNILGIAGQAVCKSSPRRYVNEGAWLCSNKVLFIKSAWGAGFGHALPASHLVPEGVFASRLCSLFKMCLYHCHQKLKYFKISFSSLT